MKLVKSCSSNSAQRTALIYEENEQRFHLVLRSFYDLEGNCTEENAGCFSSLEDAKDRFSEVCIDLERSRAKALVQTHPMYLIKQSYPWALKYISN